MPLKYSKHGEPMPGFTKTTRKEDNPEWLRAKAKAAQKRLERNTGFVAVPAQYAEVASAQAKRGPQGGGSGGQGGGRG